MRLFPWAVGSHSRTQQMAFFAVCIVLHSLIILNVIRLSADMLHGSSYAKQLFPTPIYRLKRIPRNDLTVTTQAVKSLGGDFAQIYFPAQKPSALGEAYSRATTLDPWRRPSRYPPFIHFLCATTICRLPYGYACLLNLLLQLFLFFSVLYLAFKALGILSYFPLSLLFINSCLFLTPAGLSWFERGQFSLYVAASYLLLSLGLLKKNIGWIALSALLAFVKWISLPFVFVILTVYILIARTRKELTFGILATGVVSVVIAFFSLLFIKDSLLFIRGLVEQETQYPPSPLALASYLPRFFVKSLPISLIVIGYISAIRNRDDFVNLIPYMAGTAVMLILYPTLAFDYSVPALLGLIPLMIYWVTQAELQGQRGRTACLYLFLGFIVVASFSVQLTRSELMLIIVYLAVSLGLFAVSLFPGQLFPRRQMHSP